MPKINKKAIINNVPMDITLVPFFESRYEVNEIKMGFGYANSETLEIIIPSQYQTATNFVGDYAVVQKEDGGKHSIINKNNIEVMRNFDNAYLYQLDNGTVLALTMNYHGWEVYDKGLFGRGYAQGPQRITYRLYDLNRGVLLKTEAESNPKIIIIDNYIIYYDSYDYFDIYEINTDGVMEKIDITVKDFFAKIIEEKNLQYRENNFLSYVSDKIDIYDYKNMPDKSNPYSYTNEHFILKFGYFDSLDINELIRNIPSNMKINTFGNDDNPKYDIDIINWNNRLLWPEPYPFKKRNYLYKVGLVSTESMDIKYTGLYDSTENRWVIPPVEGSGEFYIIDDNWVYYEYSYGSHWIYNTKTKEKHEAIHTGVSTLSPRRSGFHIYFHD
jgi:hypothetical protein